jgi:hypothetical protein
MSVNISLIGTGQSLDKVVRTLPLARFYYEPFPGFIAIPLHGLMLE